MEVGAFVELEDGLEAEVVDITDEKIVLNANHPLAGQDLHYDVEVVDVRDPTEADLANEKKLDEEHVALFEELNRAEKREEAQAKA